MSTSSDSAATPDATPPRSTVPRLSLRPLKTLAPKPPQAERSGSQRSAITRATLSAVGLWSCPICPVSRRRACRLSSHKSFVTESKRVHEPANGAVQPPSRQNAANDTAYANSYAYHFAQSFVDGDMAAGRVDPFYRLPVPDSTHPQLHRLFHDFFTVQLDRAVNFPRPSCFTSGPVGGILAPAAMIDPAVCLSVISLSAIIASMRIGQTPRNPSAQSLYNQATRMLRSKLSKNSRTDETILAANTLFLVSIPFGVEAAVRQTRRTVRDLVNSRGGASQLGMGGVLADYVTMAEASAALCLIYEPSVAEDVVPGVLTAPPAAIYGASFHSPHFMESLHPSMIEICLTMCRMTEVLEKAMREDATPQEYIYFYSTLKWVTIRRAQFRARCYNSGTKDECISTAVEIFRCNVFGTQPENKCLNFVCCSQLQRALVQTDISSYWDEEVEMLIWALFVVCTIEFEWESKPWFMDLLHRCLSYRYANQIWPSSWRHQTFQYLKSFLWSEARLAACFVKTCDELERLTVWQAQTEMNSMWRP